MTAFYGTEPCLGENGLAKKALTESGTFAIVNSCVKREDKGLKTHLDSSRFFAESECGRRQHKNPAGNEKGLSTLWRL